MKNTLLKISPTWMLRIGFGLMYLYSGHNLFVNPAGWEWALPSWFQGLVEHFVHIETYLRIQGLGEIVIALCLLAWFIPPKYLKYIALLSVAEMAGILVLSPIDAFSITFRDLGLLGGSLALFLLLYQKQNDSGNKRMSIG